MSSSDAVKPTVPLTTVYTPPSTCAESNYVQFFKHHQGFSWSRRTFGRECIVPNTLYNEPYRDICWSPGVCPSGWEAHTSKSQPPSDVFTSFCCPSNLQWLVPGPTFGAGFCMPTTITWDDVALQSPINGNWPIEVQWASSDLDSFSPKSAPLSPWYDFATDISSATSSSTTHQATPAQSSGSQPTSTGNTDASSNSTNNTSSGLSTGAKAGIGVGVAFAFFAALAFLLLFFRYRRKQRTAPNSTGESEVREHQLPGHELQERHQLGGNPIYEAAGLHKPREADSSPRAELDGG